MTAWEPLRVLVAEDNGDIGVVLTRLLDSAGLVVLRPVATRIEGLFGRLERERVDVLVLDLSLEDSDEQATVAAIPEMAKICAVVVVSATAHPRVAFDARERGAETFISKTGPLAGVLERAVREAWKTWSERREGKHMTTITTPGAPAKEETSVSVEGSGADRLWKAVVPEKILRKVLGPVALTVLAGVAGWFSHAAATPAGPALAPAAIAAPSNSAVQDLDQRVTALEGVAQTLRVHLGNEMKWHQDEIAFQTSVNDSLESLRTSVDALRPARPTPIASGK